MPRTTPYTAEIRASLARLGKAGAAPPHHVEAWLRLEHGTLDHLSRTAFDHEVELALECIAAASAEETEDLARSYGLA